MNENRFYVKGYEVTANNEVKNEIRNFVINEVETNKKNCSFSCVLSLDDDDWKVMSYITKMKGEKNYHLVFGVRKHDGTTQAFGVDLDFGTLTGINVNKLIGQVTRLFNEVIEQMFAECGVLTTDEKYFAEVKETIEEMVENETPHKRYSYSTYSSEYMHLFPNGINESDEIKFWVSTKVRDYYEECMKKKLVKIYDPEGKMDDFDLDHLFRSYMSMLEAKWRFMLEFGEIKNEETKMVNEEIENEVKNDAPCLDEKIEKIADEVVDSPDPRVNRFLNSFADDRNIYNIVNALCLKADADDYFEVSIYDVADYVNADDGQKKVLEKLNSISGGDYITLELDIENFAITVNSTEGNLNIYTDGYNYLQDNVTWDELIDRINKFLDGKIEKRLNEFVEDIKENGYTPCSTEEYWSNGHILMYCVEEELFEDKFDFTETTPFEIGMDLYNDKRVIAYAVFDETDIEDVVTNCLYDEEEKEIGCGYYLSIECPDDFVNGMVVIKNNEDFTTHTFNLMDYYEHIVDVYRGDNCNIVERIAVDVTDAINKMVA